VQLPTYRELRKFVEVEGWEDKDKVSRKKEGDHKRYVFTTPTGERLFTRISHGRDKIQDPDLFQHILRDQLKIDEDQFWAAVDLGKIPVRPVPEGTVDYGTSIDAKLAWNLLTKVHLTHAQLSEMTQAEAVKVWHEWLNKPR
jgi:hypothetical protein